MQRVEMHVHIGRKRKGEKDFLSVRTLPDGHVFYTSLFYAQDVTFSVQPAGLRKFRESGQKNVHAYVRGTITSDWSPQNWREVKYDPRSNDTFVDAELGFPVHRASRVYHDGARLMYANES